MKKRMLDLCCGRLGWAKAFAARGWACVGVDLIEPPEIPQGCTFIKADVLTIRDIWHLGREWAQCGFVGGSMDAHPEICDHCGMHADARAHWGFDFVCASSPCEKFSVHGMKHFHPNPPYPDLGIRLFNHIRSICERSKLPYVMENVRAAQSFVGPATGHAGSFYLWGNAVPTKLPRLIKGMTRRAMGERAYKGQEGWNANQRMGQAAKAAHVATIPSELASCVADYAERLLEQVA